MTFSLRKFGLLLLILLIATLLALAACSGDDRKDKSGKEQARSSGDTALATPVVLSHETDVMAAVAPSRNTNWTPVIRDFDGVEMVLVPAGCFMMGSEDDHRDNQKPAHKVCFEEPFWIDKTEVTNGQFEWFNGQAARASHWTGGSHPRETITWVEANVFCESRGARLPTEAEWEFAARGPDGWIYPWGNTFVADNVVYGRNASMQTADVGSRPGGASWVGALDMSGNVWEWVADWYDAEHYKTLPNGVVNPTGPTSGQYHVLRGGSWWEETSQGLRATVRDWNPPDYGSDFRGFRCARSADESAATTAP